MNLSNNHQPTERQPGHEARLRRLSPEGVEAVRARAEVRAQALANLEWAAFGRFPELRPQPQVAPEPEPTMAPQPQPTPAVADALAYPMELAAQQPAQNAAVAEAERIVAEAYQAMRQEDNRA